MWDGTKTAGVSSFSRWVCHFRSNMCLATVSNFLEVVTCCIPRHLSYMLLHCLDYWISSLDFSGCRESMLLGQKSIYDSLHLRPIYSSRPLLRGVNTWCLYNVQSWGLFIFLLILISEIYIHLLQSPRHNNNECFTGWKLTKDINTPETPKDSFTEGITYACH